jgi:hypothetical protein
MTPEALIVLALYTLCIWFVTNHFMAKEERKTWERDLGAVNLREPMRARAVKEAERLEREERAAVARAAAHADLVTRRERMRHHPQRIAPR